MTSGGGPKGVELMLGIGIWMLAWVLFVAPNPVLPNNDELVAPGWGVPVVPPKLNMFEPVVGVVAPVVPPKPNKFELPEVAGVEVPPKLKLEVPKPGVLPPVLPVENILAPVELPVLPNAKVELPVVGVEEVPPNENGDVPDCCVEPPVLPNANVLGAEPEVPVVPPNENGDEPVVGCVVDDVPDVPPNENAEGCEVEEVPVVPPNENGDVPVEPEVPVVPPIENGDAPVVPVVPVVPPPIQEVPVVPVVPLPPNENGDVPVVALGVVPNEVPKLVLGWEVGVVPKADVVAPPPKLNDVAGAAVVGCWVPNPNPPVEGVVAPNVVVAPVAAVPNWPPPLLIRW
jgi:hypothetical protein